MVMFPSSRTGWNIKFLPFLIAIFYIYRLYMVVYFPGTTVPVRVLCPDGSRNTALVVMGLSGSDFISGGRLSPDVRAL